MGGCLHKFNTLNSKEQLGGTRARFFQIQRTFFSHVPFRVSGACRQALNIIIEGKSGPIYRTKVSPN